MFRQGQLITPKKMVASWIFAQDMAHAYVALRPGQLLLFLGEVPATSYDVAWQYYYAVLFEEKILIIGREENAYVEVGNDHD